MKIVMLGKLKSVLSGSTLTKTIALVICTFSYLSCDDYSWHVAFSVRLKYIVVSQLRHYTLNLKP